jgi:hypothetical protein
MILRRENFVVTYFLSEKGQTERYKWPGLKESKMIVSERRNDDLQSDNQQNDCLSKDTQKNDNKINYIPIDAYRVVYIGAISRAISQAILH